MATSFQLRLEKYFGDTAGNEYMPTTTQMTDLFTAGLADIINKTPATLWERVATTEKLSDSSGFTVGSKKFFMHCAMVVMNRIIFFRVVKFQCT